MRSVSGATLRQTVECMYEYHCLEESGWNLCPVRSPIQPRGLLLESCMRVDCPYLSSMETGHVCVCPTHCELYDRYRF